MPALKVGEVIYNNWVRLCLDPFGGKRKLPFLWRLTYGNLRYSKGKRSLNEHSPQGKISDRTLSNQLKEF
jgi:DNA-binding HxlR family transcriptional regulator